MKTLRPKINKPVTFEAEDCKEAAQHCARTLAVISMLCGIKKLEIGIGDLIEDDICYGDWQITVECKSPPAVPIGQGRMMVQ